MNRQHFGVGVGVVDCLAELGIVVNMRLKLTRPLVVFTVRATGDDYNNDRIVELAAIKLLPDGTQIEKCRRFNPGIPISPEATAAHGITNNDVRNEPTFARVAGGDEGVAAFFAGCDLAGFDILGFTLPILQKELERAGESLDVANVAVVDAQKIFIKQEPRNLAAAVSFFCGRAQTDAHQARPDALAALSVIESQLERYSDLPDTPLGIDLATRDPNHVDRQGKFIWKNGEIAVGFGRHKGRRLRQLALDEPEYLQELIDKGVFPDMEEHLRNALRGVFVLRS